MASVCRTGSIKLFTRVNTSLYKTKNWPHSRNLFGFLTGFYSNICNISYITTVFDERNVHWDVIFTEMAIYRDQLLIALLQFQFCNETDFT